MRFAALMFFCAWVPAGTVSAQDAQSLVARAVAADDHSDRLARDYTYKIRNEIRELDGASATKSVHSTLDEVLYIGGKQYFRPLEKDGKPISQSEAQREQAKLDRTAADASHLSDAERSRRLAEAERNRARRRAQFKDIPDAFNFNLSGEAMVDGRAAYEIQAVPKVGYDGKGRGILGSIEGTLWIDENDFNWVKFEAEVLKPFSIGWFLARVSEGTHITYEMMRVGVSGNDDLWVPRAVSLKASARLALLKKLNVEQKVTFSDYRKFQTDSRIVSTGNTQ